MNDQSAFQILCNIRDRAIELAAKDFSVTTQSTGVKNIAYVVNGINYYSDARDIKEISVCENLTEIPQTKPWLRGLINSKGVLYSVSDLSLLAGYGRATPANRGHLLILGDADLQSALLVNRVVGFRYFESADDVDDLESHQDKLDGLGSFVTKACHADEQAWYELDINRLLASEQFREVQ